MSDHLARRDQHAFQPNNIDEIVIRLRDGTTYTIHGGLVKDAVVEADRSSFGFNDDMMVTRGPARSPELTLNLRLAFERATVQLPTEESDVVQGELVGEPPLLLDDGAAPG